MLSFTGPTGFPEDSDQSCTSLVVERDAALAKLNAAIMELNSMIVERDAAIVERDAAVVERDAAVVEKDAAIVEKDEAVAERKVATVEQSKLAAKLNEVVAKQDEAITKNKEIIAERDKAIAERDALADLAIAHKRATTKQLKVTEQGASSKRPLSDLFLSAPLKFEFQEPVQHDGARRAKAERPQALLDANRLEQNRTMVSGGACASSPFSSP